MSLDKEYVPTTQLYIRQQVYFRSILPGGFEINGKEGVIIEYEEHEAETTDWPKGIAICIELGPEFNRRKTWGRVDEIFPVEKYHISTSRRVEILRFALVGGMGAGVYYAALFGTTAVVGKKNYVISVAAALIANNAFNFLMQKYWAFKSAVKSKPRLLENVLPYALMAVISTSLNCYLVWRIVEYTKMHYVLAAFMVAVLLLPPSFVVSRKILVPRT